MGICVDPSIIYLNRFGYNVVRHPQAGIRPLQLIGKQSGTIARLGRLEQLITNACVPVPAITADTIAAGISGLKSGKLDADMGVSILGGFLSGMGGKIGATAKLQEAHKLQFEFGDVLSDSVSPADIGSYLKGGRVDSGNLVWQQYVLGNGQLFIITEIVKSRHFTVSAESKHAGEFKVDIPVIKEVIGGNVRVSGNSQSSSMVSFEGTEHLTFGFKCFRVGVKAGELSMITVSPGAGMALRGPGGGPDGETAQAPVTPEGEAILAHDLLELSPD